MSSEHAQTVLGGILGAEPDTAREHLDKALRHLTGEHFTDRTHATIFALLERYHDLAGGILSRRALTDVLRTQHVDAGTLLHYEETYDLLASLRVDAAAFRWSLDQLREQAAERATHEALTQAMLVLTKGTEDERGNPLHGHAAARTQLLQHFAEIDRTLSMQEAPEGDMRDEGEDMLAEYQQLKADRLAGRTQGVRFGIGPLDEKVDGLQPGELVLLVGYASEGKTSLSVQAAWSAVVEQGKNVVVLTTETIRKQVRRRMIARHSCLPVFGLPDGLNSRDLKNTSLTPAQEQKYREILHDWQHNERYGRAYVAQIPRGATIAYIESKLVRVQREMRVDLVIMDYLALLRPERRRNSNWEEMSNTLKEAKQLAVTFNDGNGVPFVSPWQVSRAARTEAERTGSYNMSALSETAEAEKSADLIISLLGPMDNDKRHARLKMQVMKARDGERCNSIEVDVDYATSRFYQRDGTAAPGIDALFGADPFARLGV